MFGPRIGTVFASRWKALWWGAGVLLTAYCSVPSTDQEATVAGPPAHKAAKNPWALETSGGSDAATTVR